MTPTLTASPAVTLRNEQRDFPEWHLGRPTYALWALDFDATPLLPHMEAAQRHLAAWLLPAYARQPHITLGLCGFPSRTPQHDDDFGQDTFEAHLANLHALQPRPFALDIGALDSFSSVPYFSVREAGAQAGTHLAALRDCVATAATNHTGSPYVPHVTVGLYADAWPLADVLASLRSFSLAHDIRVQVTGICLLGYAARVIGGPLHTLGRFDFESRTFGWAGKPAFGAAQAPT